MALNELIDVPGYASRWSTYSPDSQLTLSRPDRRPAFDNTANAAVRRNDNELRDGLRVLDVAPLISPLEKARLYHHSTQSRLDVVQSWEGAVTGIDEDSRFFTARLYDLDNPTAEVSEAEFDVRDVSTNDMDLLKIGGIFRWMIGYRVHSYGQRERVSAIVFRRLPSWDQAEIARASELGAELAGSIQFR